MNGDTHLPKFFDGQLVTAKDLNALVDWVDQSSRAARRDALRVAVVAAAVVLACAKLCCRSRR